MFELFEWIDELLDHQTFQVLATLGLALTLLVLRGLILRALGRSAMIPEGRRRWQVTVRNVALVLFVFGTVAIWAAELRTFALSVVAIAAALVLALKELIMCVSGSFLRTVTRNVALGDRVEIAGQRGDVVDMGLLTTTLLEVGPGRSSHQRTGRLIAIPNSLWLTSSMIKESFASAFVLHTLTLAFDKASAGRWEQIEARLLAAGEAECAPFIEDARQHFEALGRAQGLDTPGVDPKVSLSVPAPDRVEFSLRFPAPAKSPGRIEQAILRRFLRLEAGEAEGAEGAERAEP